MTAPEEALVGSDVMTDVAIIGVRGRGAGMAVTLGAALTDRLRAGCRHLIVDCGEIETLPTAGWGLLLAWAHEARVRGGGLCLVRLPAHLAEVLRAHGIDGLLPVFDSAEEALGALGGRRPVAEG